MSSADLPPDAELLAAEAAFGLLEGDELSEAEARLRHDPAFAAAHDRWLAYAVTIAGTAAEKPSPAVWDALHNQLAANGPGAVSRPNNALRRWRLTALAASLAAVVLSVVAIGELHRPELIKQVEGTAHAPLVAVLTGTDVQAVLTVSYDDTNGRLTVVPRRIVTGGKVAELWVIPAGQKPRAIGVVPVDRSSWHLVSPALRQDLTSTATLAVSLEPAGGSPTGQPTGPVILSGKSAFAS